MAYIKNPIQAISYSKFRPTPPNELIHKIVNFLKEEIASPLGVALDVGCGSGQSTEVLSPYFRQVIGIDSSADQLKHAKSSINKHKNVLYRNGNAEKLEEADNSVDLITVGMAIHWFDLERFSVEAGRVLCPNGVLALYGYNLPQPSINGVCLADSFHSMIEGTLGPYFPEESRHAYFEGYRDTKFSKFPFSNKPADRIIMGNLVKFGRGKMVRMWLSKCPVLLLFKENRAHEYEFLSTNKAKLRDLIGYVSTMSGFQNYMKTHGEDSAQQLLSQFRTRVAENYNGTTDNATEEIEVEITFSYFLLLSRKNVEQ